MPKAETETIGAYMPAEDVISLAIAIMSQPPQQQVPPPDGVVDDAGREAESYLEWVTRFA